MSDNSSDYIPETLPPALPETPPPIPPEKPPRLSPELLHSLSTESPMPVLYTTLPRSRPRTPIRTPTPTPSDVQNSTSAATPPSITIEVESSSPSVTQSSTSSEAQPSASLETQPPKSPKDQPSTSETEPSTSSETQPSTPSEAEQTPLYEVPLSTEPEPSASSVAEQSASSGAPESQPPALPSTPPPVIPAVTVAAAEGDRSADAPPDDAFLDAEDQSAVLLRRESSLRRQSSLRRKEPAPYADTTLKRVSSQIDRIGSAISRFLDREKVPGSGDRERPKSADFLGPGRRSNEKRTENAESKNSLIPFGSNFLRRSFRQKPEEYEEDSRPPSPSGSSVRGSVYNEDLVSSLVCAACAHYMVGPIEQCKRGHNICKFCRRRAHQQRCPTCGARLTGIRNRVAEDMARKLLFPCVHAHAGCTRQVPNDELEFHEPRCPFRVYNCLINVTSGVPCKWEGRRVDLEEHVRGEHPRYYSEQETTKWRWQPNLVVKMEDFQLISAFGELFWYCAAQDPERLRVCWFVQHVGYDQDSVRFEYRFAMADSSERRLDFRCTTLPDYSSAGSIVESGHCVDMSYQQALSFLDDENTISFSVTMHQVEA